MPYHFQLLRSLLPYFLAVLPVNSSLCAGPVNSPGSLPFAAANATGDRLTFGDAKGLVYWHEEGTERAAALRWRSAKELAATRFTGGLAAQEQRLQANPAAIACSETQTFLFYPARSVQFPAGKWLDPDEAKLPSLGRRRCAMLADGTYAELHLEAATIQLDRAQTLTFGGKNSGLELIAAGAGFMVLSPKGEAWSIYRDAELWKISASWPHPLQGFSSAMRLTANQNWVLKADPEGNALFAIDSGPTGPKLGQSQRLPVNPCEDDQVCGLSLASDNSWLLSGYWGHYLGQGQNFRRLNIPLSVQQEGGGVAIAHSAAGGIYIYLGADDGDQGTLPAGSPKVWLSEVTSRPKAWMIWRQKAESEASAAGLHSLPLAVAEPSEAAPEMQMFVWQGPLPTLIPRHWVAWERAQDYAAPDWQTESALSSDPDRWFLMSLGVPEAWAMAAQSGIQAAPIHAAVIDSGIDSNHPWLQQQLFQVPNEIPANGMDDDGNGYVDDVWGYDFVEEDALPQDEFGHGTHVAGLLAGREPSSGFSLSPAPNLKLTVLRALDSYGKSNSIDLARALLYAADNGAKLINCSWGGGPDSQALRDAFAILQSRGVLVFSSAGNDKLNTDQYPEVPKIYPGVRSIAASNRRGQLASFSNFGLQSVRYLAPGESIRSTIPGGGWVEKSGTSMASPLAAASFAWLWGVVKAKEPELSDFAAIEKVDSILCESASRQDSAGRSVCGRLQLDQAFQLYQAAQPIGG